MSALNSEAPRCECGALETLSKEPSIPIVFDAELNEYHLVGTAQQQILIYHCIFCGGQTPASRRDELFMHVTKEEFEKLRKATNGLKTVDGGGFWATGLRPSSRNQFHRTRRSRSAQNHRL